MEISPRSKLIKVDATMVSFAAKGNGKGGYQIKTRFLLKR